MLKLTSVKCNTCHFFFSLPFIGLYLICSQTFLYYAYSVFEIHWCAMTPSANFENWNWGKALKLKFNFECYSFAFLQVIWRYFWVKTLLCHACFLLQLTVLYRDCTKFPVKIVGWLATFEYMAHHQFLNKSFKQSPTNVLIFRRRWRLSQQR